MSNDVPKPQPVYINFFFHHEDFVNRNLSQPAIRRLAEIFVRAGIRCDIYYTAILLDFLSREAPDTLALLRDMHLRRGYGLGYHGEPHGPNPTVWVYVNEHQLGLDEGIEWCLRHDTQRLDPLTGQLDPTSEGGILLHDRLIGKQSTIAVATLFGPQWFLAMRKLGVKMQLGGEWTIGGIGESLTAQLDGNPLVWWVGHLLMADIHQFWMTEPTSTFDRTFATLDRSHPNMITIASHDCDMYQEKLWAPTAFGGNNLGNPSGENPATFEEARLQPQHIRSAQGQEATYQRIEAMMRHVAAAAEADPSIQVVTCDDLYAKVYPATRVTFAWPEVLTIARVLANPENWRHASGVRPPNFLNLEGTQGDYVTLSEAFGALSSALASYAVSGQFPSDVPNSSLLGPAELAHEPDPIGHEGGEVPAQAVIEAARALSASLTDRVPLEIAVGALDHRVNAAEFLFLMACLVERLARSEQVADISIPLMNSHLLTPLAWTIMEAAVTGKLHFPLPDAYDPKHVTARHSFQQMWALKPARWR